MDASNAQQTNRLQSLLKVLPAGVVVLNGKGVVIQCNPQASQLLGKPLEGELWRTVIKRAFKPRADDGHEVSLTNGQRVKLEITPLEGEPGQLILLTDLTETRALQARVSHMQRLSSLGKMVASLAHQIRTPLSAAMLYATNIAQQSLSPAMRVRFGEKLEQRLKELEHQVNDMLLFAKSGEQQVVSDMSLSDLTESAMHTAQTLASQKGVKLEVSQLDLPVTLRANQTSLQGALLNIIDNAIQVSMPNQTVRVAAEFFAEEITISVSDQGPGISAEKQESIFTPFYTTKTNGTGLGLAVVKSVMQSHGGRVSVDTSIKQGATFRLTLPAEMTFSRAIGE